MYDMPMPAEDNGEDHKKKEELGSRIRHIEWAAEDYDRRRGKGAFFKKYTDTKDLLDKLYDEKVKCMKKEAQEVLKEVKK